MPRRHRHTRKAMRGGFLDSWANWVSQSANNLWQKTKDVTSSLTGSNTSSPIYNSTSAIPEPVSTPPMTTTPTMSYGGRTRRRRMKGGFRDNSPTTGIAAHAASFSGKTASAQMVGGRRRRSRRVSKK